MVDSWWTFGRQNLLACEIHHLHYSTDEIRCKSTKPLQCPYKYPTKSLHFLYWHLAGGVAFSKYNFEKFKGLGIIPTSNLAKWGPGSTACKVVNVYTFTLLANLQNLYRFALLAKLVLFRFCIAHYK